MVTGHVNTELPPVARIGQAAMTNMKLDVEIFIIGPVWVVEFKRHVNEPALEYRRGVEAALDKLNNVFQAYSAVRRT